MHPYVKLIGSQPGKNALDKREMLHQDVYERLAKVYNDESREDLKTLPHTHEMCEKTKAALQHQSGSIVGTGTAVKPVRPPEASTVYKNSSSGANSSDDSSYTYAAKGKNTLGNNHEKRVRTKEQEIVTLSRDSSS